MEYYTARIAARQLDRLRLTAIGVWPVEIEKQCLYNASCDGTGLRLRAMDENFIATGSSEILSFIAVGVGVADLAIGRQTKTTEAKKHHRPS